jgi:FdhD protein
MPRPSAPDIRIRRWEAGSWSDAPDAVVMEEPLQLLLDGEPLSVVMRTPGQDIELALGLLFAEGIVRSLDDIREMRISAESGEGDAPVPSTRRSSTRTRSTFTWRVRDARSLSGRCCPAPRAASAAR